MRGRDEDVAVPHLTERLPEPPKVFPEPVGPFGVGREESRGAEERAQPPRCDTLSVKDLRIVTDHDARLTLDDLTPMPANGALERVALA